MTDTPTYCQHAVNGCAAHDVSNSEKLNAEQIPSRRPPHEDSGSTLKDQQGCDEDGDSPSSQAMELSVPLSSEVMNTTSATEGPTESLVSRSGAAVDIPRVTIRTSGALTVESSATLTPSTFRGPDCASPVVENNSSSSVASRLSGPGLTTMYDPAKSNHCTIHRPTLEEIKALSFSDYIRRNVLTAARVLYEDDDDDNDDDEGKNGTPTLSHPIELREGIAKVVLPAGFSLEEGIGHDRTGRGPQWAKGSPVGDYEIHSPILQNVRGVAGLYEYTFTDQPAISVAEFRDKADEYRKRQVGCAVEDNYDGRNMIPDDRLKSLERLFWKRIGPTMPPALYGADQEGTFFDDADDCCGWNLSRLDSCLQILQDRIPGVTSSYLYLGMWASVFCAHTEDMNLLSINYLHAGQPKVWYAICETDSNRFLSLAHFHYSQQASQCKEFLRHKRSLISPAVLKKAGIRYQTAVQYPGEAIITFPASYHFGFSLGFNLAEATNFGVQEWIPFGQSARICLCRPDSVRIDMSRLTALLERYEQDQKKKGKRLRLTWNEWRLRREAHKRRKGGEDIGGASRRSQKTQSGGSKRQQLSDQQRKKEFWIEVMKPVPSGRQVNGNRVAVGSKKGKTKLASSSEDIWHLAKPIRRRSVQISMRVLCVMPTITADKAPDKARRSRHNDSDSEEEDDDEEEDEQCFAGHIVEIADDHARIRLDGLPKSEDTWIPLNSSKLFLDGGRWADDDKDRGIPPLHYWQEMDSKRLCVDKRS